MAWHLTLATALCCALQFAGPRASADAVTSSSVDQRTDLAPQLKKVRLQPAVRGPGAAEVELQLVAADDGDGRTLRAAPTLYFVLSGPPWAKVQFTLVSYESNKVLANVQLSDVSAGKLYAINFDRLGLSLSPGVECVWNVAVYPTPSTGAPDALVAKAVVQYKPDATLLAKQDAGNSAQWISALKSARYWYDAFAAAAADPSAGAQLHDLLKAAGIADSAH
jgi:hypothetical protein